MQYDNDEIWKGNWFPKFRGDTEIKSRNYDKIEREVEKFLSDDYTCSKCGNYIM